MSWPARQGFSAIAGLATFPNAIRTGHAWEDFDAA
jgi:hypothetical protein